MPAVVWCAIGFVAGDLAGLLRSGAWWPLAPLCAAAAVAARSRRSAWAALTAAAAGVVWGAASASRAARDCRSRWREGERVAVQVRLWDAATPGAASRTVVDWPQACAGPLEVLWPAWGEAPATAAVIVGTWHRTALSPLWPARPERLGRLVARRVRSVARYPGVRGALRLATERRIVALFGPARAGLAAALTVGAGDQLDREIRRRFARAGIAHILAISGLHVGILAAALLLVLRAARVGDATARLAGTALVAAYVVLLGLPPPAVRALGLIALWAWARVRQRPMVPGAALASTALAVLAVEPFAAAEAGAWLSFAGAWGCTRGARVWAALRRERVVPRNRAVATLSVAAVSGGATLATAPFSVVAFGTMSPAALVSNVLAVPLACIAMPALALTVLLAAVLPAAARWVAPVAAVGLDGLDAVARLAGALPLASIGIERRLLAATLLAGVAWMLLGPLRARARDGTWRGLRARAALAAALALCAAVWWPLVPGSPSGDRAGWLALHFLAVGQGDAAAIRTPGGRWVVVDGGPRTFGYDAGSAVVVPFLRRAGAGPGRLALVVASHGDEDHLGGLPAVVRAFPPALVLEPGEPLPKPSYRAWLGAVAEAGSRWRRGRAGDSVAVDGVIVRVLHPDSAWMERGLPANENGVVVALEYGAFRALMAGDAGLAFEEAEAGQLPRATLLKVAHHGSISATGPALVAAVRPRICVVSVGPNHFGQPDPRVLGALARAGCDIFRTDTDGAVTVETDGRTVHVAAGARDTSFISTREEP
ncbi:MAG TPA: ComEC/Rec2 family competence protein [Gemmatimonadales bacterium]|nr:ComEC/Rec2 family competence protein [Gemmatimonadales bacterium]